MQAELSNSRLRAAGARIFESVLLKPQNSDNNKSTQPARLRLSRSLTRSLARSLARSLSHRDEPLTHCIARCLPRGVVESNCVVRWVIIIMHVANGRSARAPFAIKVPNRQTSLEHAESALVSDFILCILDCSCATSSRQIDIAGIYKPRLQRDRTAQLVAAKLGAHEVACPCRRAMGMSLGCVGLAELLPRRRLELLLVLAQLLLLAWRQAAVAWPLPQAASLQATPWHSRALAAASNGSSRSNAAVACAS